MGKTETNLLILAIKLLLRALEGLAGKEVTDEELDKAEEEVKKAVDPWREDGR